MNPARSYGVEEQNHSSDSIGSLEHRTNLAQLNINSTALELESRNIVNISDLARLRQLQSLELFDNQIVDITPLTRLTNLQSLELGTNEIVDIGPLAHLRGLRVLSLDDNQIVDIAPLGSLTNVRELDLSTNQIVDIAPLGSLTNVRELDLSGNQIEDITPLANLTNVQELNLSDNQIVRIISLRRFRQLQSLDLSGNQIVNTTPLATLATLKELYLGRNQIADIAPLGNLERVQELYLRHNQIENITPLGSLTNLQLLDLFNNQIVDIHSLARLMNVQELNLGYNQIENITPLADLTNVQELNLSGNRIIDIRPLEHLINVRALNLSHNQIVDINTLARLTNVQELNLSGNQITDIHPLMSLTNLQELNLGGNPIALNPNLPRIIETLRQRNPNLTTYFDDEDMVGQEAIMAEGQAQIALNPNLTIYFAHAQIVAQEAIMAQQKPQYDWLLNFLVSPQFTRQSTDVRTVTNVQTVREKVSNIQTLKDSASSLYAFMTQQKDAINTIEASLRTQHQSKTLFKMEQAINGMRLLTGEETDEGGVALPCHKSSSYDHYINLIPHGLVDQLPKLKELFYITLKTAQNKLDRVLDTDKTTIIDNAVTGHLSDFVMKKNGGRKFGVDTDRIDGFITINPDTEVPQRSPKTKGDQVKDTLKRIFLSANEGQRLEDQGLGALFNLLTKKIYAPSVTKDLYNPIQETIHTNMQQFEQEVQDKYYIPIIEACFMTMRGHNTQLENPAQTNRPACADGAYLQVLTALQTITTNATFVGVPAQVHIVHCLARY